ncbi:MAG: SDR family oxidoreductase [Magnetococcales bacterium]|nr:SDR family oxidoreductase [Magnetococcales bacterium]
MIDIRTMPALVTGGSQRIGAASALALARKGASVVIHYGRSDREAKTLCEKIQQQGGRGATLQADLESADQVETLVERAEGFFGPLQILVNNAAIFQPGLIKETPLEQWQAHLSINLTAPFLLMQAFARRLPEETPGKIINLIDQRVLRPRPGHVAYSAAKSALWALTQMAAQEMAPNIQVNAIGPGPILPAPNHEPGGFERVAQRTPLGRPGSPEDITQALIFLLEQTFITGEMVCVDGGEHLV